MQSIVSFVSTKTFHTPFPSHQRTKRVPLNSLFLFLQLNLAFSSNERQVSNEVCAKLINFPLEPERKREAWISVWKCWCFLNNENPDLLCFLIEKIQNYRVFFWITEIQNKNFLLRKPLKTLCFNE
jgi:hypothetical protein